MTLAQIEVSVHFHNCLCWKYICCHMFLTPSLRLLSSILTIQFCITNAADKHLFCLLILSSVVLVYLKLQWFVADVKRHDIKSKSVQIMHKISLNIQAEILQNLNMSCSVDFRWSFRVKLFFCISLMSLYYTAIWWQNYILIKQTRTNIGEHIWWW